MFDVNRNKAEYMERIKHSQVEQINDHTQFDYLDGWIVFNYTSISDKKKSVERGGIRMSVEYKVLETKADLPFKKGDIIRLDNKKFEVNEVDIKVLEQYQSLVAMSPNVKDRYSVKVLSLYG